MQLLDLLSHALTTLAASLPSVLSPQSTEAGKSAYRSLPGTYDTGATSDPVCETSNTPDAAEGLASDLTELEKTRQRNPKLLKIQTSRGEHEDMDAVKMIGNTQVVQEILSVKKAGVLNPNTGFREPLSPGMPSPASPIAPLQAPSCSVCFRDRSAERVLTDVPGQIATRHSPTPQRTPAKTPRSKPALWN